MQEIQTVTIPSLAEDEAALSIDYVTRDYIAKTVFMSKVATVKGKWKTSISERPMGEKEPPRPMSLPVVKGFWP